MDAVLLLVMAFATFLIPILIGAGILMPLDRAARFRRAKTQFHMIDFFGLMFLLTLSMGILRAVIVPTQRDGIAAMVVGNVVLWIVAGIVWAKSVTVFSQAGIEAYNERAVLVFFVLPMAFAGNLAVVLCGFALVASWGQPNWWAWLTLQLFLIVGLTYSVFLTRRIERTVARQGAR